MVSVYVKVRFLPLITTRGYRTSNSITFFVCCRSRAFPFFPCTGAGGAGLEVMNIYFLFSLWQKAGTFLVLCTDMNSFLYNSIAPFAKHLRFSLQLETYNFTSLWSKRSPSSIVVHRKVRTKPPPPFFFFLG